MPSFREGAGEPVFLSSLKIKVEFTNSEIYRSYVGRSRGFDK